ncbi:hypothetical protein NL676_025444 [Syzygium grande]|nr:hypothetical protein NL676_025444 [Syzygium grande]
MLRSHDLKRPRFGLASMAQTQRGLPRSRNSRQSSSRLSNPSKAKQARQRRGREKSSKPHLTKTTGLESQRAAIKKNQAKPTVARHLLYRYRLFLLASAPLDAVTRTFFKGREARSRCVRPPSLPSSSLSLSVGGLIVITDRCGCDSCADIYNPTTHLPPVFEFSSRSFSFNFVSPHFVPLCGSILVLRFDPTPRTVRFKRDGPVKVLRRAGPERCGGCGGGRSHVSYSSSAWAGLGLGEVEEDWEF